MQIKLKSFIIMQKAIQIDQLSADLFFKFLELTYDCPKLLGLLAKRPLFFYCWNFYLKVSFILTCSIITIKMFL